MWPWKLAIKGHPTRGKEIIEFLEMLGGRNILNLGTDVKIEEDLLYTINRSYHFGDIIEGVNYAEDTWILTDIEECLKLYPFKVGDKVHIPEYESEVSICKAKWNSHPFCRHVEYLVYRNDEEVWYSTQELKECNADFLTNKEEKKSLLASLIEYFSTTPKDELEREWNEHNELDEIGPTVEEYIAFAESIKKQSKYPKTYEECCKIVGANPYIRLMYDLSDGQNYPYDIENLQHYENMRRLLICRDAYWKIAGEQMGLKKYWLPDWSHNGGIKYTIEGSYSEIIFNKNFHNHQILVFPTEEMRDAFYENFKDLIEKCY